MLLGPTILFLCAGRLDWVEGWVYVGVLLTGTVASRLVVLPLSACAVSGLDCRLGWSPRMPVPLVVAGGVAVAASYAQAARVDMHGSRAS